jgi:transposase InsO family protein
MEAVLKGSLYVLKLAEDGKQQRAMAAKESPSADLWHRRFSHLNHEAIKTLSTKGLVEGLDIAANPPQFCEACIEGKAHKHPFPTLTTRRSTELLELVHSDICGEISPNTISGFKYFISFIDDKSRYGYVKLLERKSDAFEAFKEFKAKAELETGKKIKVLRTDNGGEYIGEKFEEFLASHGIKHELTTPYTPEQNGLAERYNRTIVEAVRSMLFDMGMSKQFWGEAVMTAVYTRNRSPSRAIDNVTPYSIYKGRNPNVSHFRVFGSTAYALILSPRTKLEPKTRKCLFLGYDERSKGYKLVDITTLDIVRSRNVTFIEDAKPIPAIIDDGLPFHPFAQPTSHDNNPPPPPDILSVANLDHPIPVDDVQVPFPVAPAAGPADAPPQPPVQRYHASGRPRRNAGPPQWREDDLANATTEEDFEREINRTVQARALTVSVDFLEPRTVEEAMASEQREQWEKAMKEEYDALIRNETWRIELLPEGRLPVGCRWIFKFKRDGQGNITRYKARLVAQGFAQLEGIDYEETFAPVAKFTSIRTALALAAHYDWHVEQMDVKSAFLNGVLEEEIYMRQPPGFLVGDGEIYVCRMQRALYGLKQAPRVWNQTINEFLLNLGFIRSEADHCVYSRVRRGSIIIIILYVDDTLHFTNNIRSLRQIQEQLSRRFEMTFIGDAEFILGLQITRDRINRTIQLSQTSYINEIVRRFGLQDANAVSTPLPTSTRLTRDMSPQTSQEIASMRDVPYLRAIGSIMYAMLGTRPDIAYAVGVLSQYGSNPGPEHWAALKRVIRYLKGTAHFALQYGGAENGLELVGWTDSDWASDLDTRRSIAGFTLDLNGGSISWSSKKQPTVALSTVEAEYMATTQATREAIWLRSLLTDLGSPPTAATIVHADNQGSISLARNPVNHARTKHIDIRYHFIRERIESGEIDLRYVSTADQVADILTKALPKDKHWKLMRLMGLVEGSRRSGSVERRRA